MTSESQAHRENTSIQVRTCSPEQGIDPGFINQRKIMSVFGSPLINVFEKHRNRGEDHFTKLKNDHMLTKMCVDICKELKVKSLSQALIEGVSEGQLVCSTEQLKGNQAVWEKRRVKNEIISTLKDEPRKIFIAYSTKHIFADTTKGELSNGTKNSILGEVRSISDDEIIIHPLIMGAPTYQHSNEEYNNSLIWLGSNQYEVFPEDIKQFTKIRDVGLEANNEWIEVMKKLPEAEVKNHIADILGDLTKKDWGGEQNDHFTSNITLGNNRTTAAFLLKGPSSFKEMQPSHLGKNADQIYRLANSPAELLIVQHSHDIGEAVRDTLRNFAVTPQRQRHYCFIDGKDTYKILKAYNKL